jgi:hypothetical protein
MITGWEVLWGTYLGWEEIAPADEPAPNYALGQRIRLDARAYTCAYCRRRGALTRGPLAPYRDDYAWRREVKRHAPKCRWARSRGELGLGYEDPTRAELVERLITACCGEQWDEAARVLEDRDLETGRIEKPYILGRRGINYAE